MNGGGGGGPRSILRLHPEDNVATALAALEVGMEVAIPPHESGENGPAGATAELRVESVVAFGHKLALAPIPPGGEVRKYGEVIGRATRDIKPGEHVHVHNVESQRGRGDLVQRG